MYILISSAYNKLNFRIYTQELCRYTNLLGFYFRIVSEVTRCDLHLCTSCVNVVDWRTEWLFGLQVSMNQLFKRAMPLFYRLVLCVLFLISIFAHSPFVLDFLITNVSCFLLIMSHDSIVSDSLLLIALASWTEMCCIRPRIPRLSVPRQGQRDGGRAPGHLS
jgi:hypothetical protein